MLRRLEAGARRDDGDRQAGLTEELECVLDASAPDVVGRRDAEVLAEETEEMRPAHIGGRGHAFDAERLAEVLLDERERGLECGRGATWTLEIAIEDGERTQHGDRLRDVGLRQKLAHA